MTNEESHVQAPIAKLIVSEDDRVRAVFYTPGLPPGEHDVYCEPPSPNGEKVMAPWAEHDLVSELREHAEHERIEGHPGPDVAYFKAGELMKAAADEIERLRLNGEPS